MAPATAEGTGRQRSEPAKTRSAESATQQAAAGAAPRSRSESASSGGCPASVTVRTASTSVYPPYESVPRNRATVWRWGWAPRSASVAGTHAAECVPRACDSTEGSGGGSVSRPTAQASTRARCSSGAPGHRSSQVPSGDTKVTWPSPRTSHPVEPAGQRAQVVRAGRELSPREFVAPSALVQIQGGDPELGARGTLA